MTLRLECTAQYPGNDVNIIHLHLLCTFLLEYSVWREDVITNKPVMQNEERNVLYIFVQLWFRLTLYYTCILGAIYLCEKDKRHKKQLLS